VGRLVPVKLGKLPHSHDARDLRFASYLTALPAVPAVFGHEAVVKNWNMLGNDQYGDCVWAGAAHEVEMWTRESKTHPDASFTDANVLSDYSAVTGFDPNDPSSDQGTDMRAAADYRRKVGIVDSKGRRHKIGAYVGLSVGNVEQLAEAVYLFGAVGIGIQFPSSAMTQFNQGKPWDYVSGARIEGGHYIAGVGRSSSGNFLVVTWGKVIEATPRFLARYMDEGLAYLSTEALAYSKSPEGFDVKQLQADLSAL